METNYSYTKTVKIEVDVTELIDAIFEGDATLYEALSEQGINEDTLDDIFYSAPEVIKQLKHDIGKELLKKTRS